MPVAGVDYPRTYQQFLAWFPDDQSCVDYLERVRWSDGFACPACDHDRFWRTGNRLRMCARCGRKTSVMAGTIFHRSHTPLTTWFAAIWFVMSQKNGISALGLQRVLGFGSYETAWAWLHKLRRAMVRPERERLRGVVELDEVYIGGVTEGGYGSASSKYPVIVAVENLDQKQLGRVRLQMAGHRGSGQQVEFACHVIEAGATIRTDGLRVYRKLADLGYTHQYVVGLSSDQPAHESLPGVHLVSTLLKRWLLGTLHLRFTPDQLPYYLDEFSFRFNRRRSASRGLLFYRLLQQALHTDPQPLATLKIGKGS